MDTEQLRVLLGNEHELRGVEAKAGGPYNKASAFTARIVKAAIGMSNLRDGGVVIIGVEEPDGGGLTSVGLDEDDLATWDADTLSTLINNYADPSIEIALHKVTVDGLTHVVVTVEEFHETPTICAKSLTIGGTVVLREGALYVRSRRKRETAEVSTSEDMREVLQLATERRLAEWVATGQRAGVFSTLAQQEEAEDKYAAERADLL